MLRVVGQEGWIKKGWSKGGPPFRRVDAIRVDQKRVVEGWFALQKVGRYKGGAGKGLRRVGLRGVGHLFLSLNICIIKITGVLFLIFNSSDVLLFDLYSGL